MKYLIYSLVIITLIIPFGVFSYQQQWFTTYSESSQWLSFQCTQQCFILLWDKGSYDSVKIEWLKGQWQLVIGAVGQNGQLVPLWQQNIIQNQLDYILIINSSQGEIPSDVQLWIVFVGSISADNAQVSLWSLSFWDKVVQWFREAMQYKEYNPRTINFLEGPMWNGKYINQVFFWWIILLLLICFVWYLYNIENKRKNIRLFSGVAIITFFWLFFDFFATLNQVKIYQHAVHNTESIMMNARLWNSDYYGFLVFIQQNTLPGQKTYFSAPYPFDFEWRYHNYPHNRIGLLTWSDYIIYYNPMWPNNGMWYKDPVFDSSSSTLTIQWMKLQIDKIIEYSAYAKIYTITK